MYYFNKYTLAILDRYLVHTELIDSLPIAFTGTASEKPAPVFTTEVNADTLIWAGNVNFSNANALVRIKSISPQYEWMSNNDPIPQDTPLGAVFGVSTQALPVLPLVMPFFLKANGRLQMQFTNSAAAATTGGVVTWRLLKLTMPIKDSLGVGWDYGMPWPWLVPAATPGPLAQ